jgi:hypothetical protein
MNDAQYQRLVDARKQGRNPDDRGDDPPARKIVTDSALDTLLAATDLIAILRKERDMLRAKIAELEAR